MDLFPLRESVVFEQRLDMLPTRQTTNLANVGDVHYLGKTASRCIAEDRPFHVCWFHLATSHSKLSSVVNQSLSDIDGIAVSLREAERDVDLVLRSCFTDLPHLGAVDFERVLHVSDIQLEVYRSAPAKFVNQKALMDR